MSDKTKEQIKSELIDAVNVAEKLAYEYFTRCETGSEREAAHKVYENIRTSVCVSVE